MTDFIKDTTVEFKRYDDGAQGDGLTRIQWRNGEAKLRTGGYFFVSKERIGDFVPGAPWVACEEVFESGATADGYKAEALKLAIIGVRQQPFIRRETGKFWVEKYAKGEQGASLQVDVLCVAEGLEDLGLIVWGSATVKTSFAIVGRPDGIIHKLHSDVLKPAAALAKREFRPWCFWATVATERDDKGKVVYTQTQGKPVTRPVLQVPREITKDSLNAIYTGREMVLWGEERRAEYDEWLKERRTNDAPTNDAPRKNQPQEIGADADLPF